MKLGDGALDTSSRDERLALAQEIRHAVTELNAAIPNPTPATRRWVQKEGDEIRSVPDFPAERAIAWRTSREYLHVRIKDVHSFLEQWLDCVVDSNRLSREIWCWSGMSLNLIDDELWDALSYARIWCMG